MFGVIELPESLFRHFPKNMGAAMVGDSLSVLVYDSRMYNKRRAIWVMKEYSVVGAWSKQYNIDLDGRLVLPLGLRKNGETLVGMGKELVSCDPESEEVEKLGVRGCKDSFCMGNYMDSLVLLEEGIEVVDGPVSSSEAVADGGEPDLSKEEDGPDEATVEFRAYYKQTVMSNADETCLLVYRVTY